MSGQTGRYGMMYRMAKRSGERNFWTYLGVTAIVLAVGLVGYGLIVSMSRDTVTTATPAYQAPAPQGSTAQQAATVDPSRLGSVLFIGDSWTQGTAAEPLTEGFAYVAGRTLGVPFEVHGYGGAGYVRPATAGTGNFAASWATVTPERTPDTIVVEGSINDQNETTDAIRSAATSFIEGLRAQFPDAQIVMFGPAPPDAGQITGLQRIDSTLRTVASTLDVAYISPLTDQWITTDNLTQLMDGATVPHPNNEGHTYVAQRLVAALRGNTD